MFRLRRAKIYEGEEKGILEALKKDSHIKGHC